MFITFNILLFIHCGMYIIWFCYFRFLMFKINNALFTYKIYFTSLNVNEKNI